MPIDVSLPYTVKVNFEVSDTQPLLPIQTSGSHPPSETHSSSLIWSGIAVESTRPEENAIQTGVLHQNEYQQ